VEPTSSIWRPEGSRFLRNVGQYLHCYMAYKLRRSIRV